MQIHNTIIETIGDTPLVRLNHVTGGIEAQVVVKVEFFNPGGSIKDRIGIQIVEDAEKEGRLKPGGTIVEATSGNTGVGLAIAAALRGYKCVFVLADKQSQEKIQVLRAFGARVIVTPTDVEPEDPRSYYSVARRVVEETPNAILANQYHNPSNPRTHYLTTGPEIWEQTDGKVDVVVMGVGTGGTITGVSRYLKEKNPDIKIVGVDPMGSILYKHWKTGETDGAYSYLTEGIGEDFVPTSYDASSVDDYVQVTDKESFLMLRRLVREEGIFAGVSCGSAVAGALKYVRREQLGPDKLVVVILPDSGTRYLSKAFNDDWMRENGLLDPIWIGASVETLLDQRPPQKVILATCDEAISSVVQKMREHNVSQLPVIDDESTLVGIVQEVDLLNYMLQNGATNNAEIGLEDAGVVSKDIATVNMNTALESLMTIFNTQPVVVVVDNDRVQNIITKIDLIDFLAKSGA